MTPHWRTQRTALRTTTIAAAAIMVITGCSADGRGSTAGPGGQGEQPERQLPALQLASSLRLLDSCDDVRAWAHDELAPRVGAYGFPGGGVGIEEDIAVERAQAEGATSSSDAALSSGAPASTAERAAADQSAGGNGGVPTFSDTNVQVEDVDEPDIVKTDGERILAVANGRLHLASAGRNRVLDSVALPETMYDAQLLLAGDRAIVFGSADYGVPVPLAEGIDGGGATQPPPQPEPHPSIPSTRVMQVDIDGDTLAVTDTLELDGVHVSARMTGDVARLVVHADPLARLPFVTPAAPNPQAESQAEQHNQDVVEQASAEDLLPTWRQLDSQGNVTDQGPLLDCEDAHAPNTFSGFGMVAVVTVDLSDGLKPGIASADGAGVLAGGQTVYASAEHLYVAAPEWVDSMSLPQPFPQGDGDLRAVEQTAGTDIHRFDISDPTRATYDMSGHVDGELLDQFAMDEHDGHLRVATTTSQAWIERGGAGESESHVVVLAPRDGALTEVGRVSGLGRGETIQSVRFLGTVGYVVTFEQTDPLYTIDLSDPAAPRVAGELKILGYSAYLHPIGDGRLIGVGQDATEDGRQLGTQVALFDVRDPAAPTRVAQATLPNSSSGAEWDHHAFLWWPDAGLVAIPVSGFDGTPFEGLVGYTVDVDGATITERGRIVHPTQVDVPPGGPGKPVPLPTEPGAGTGAGVSGDPGPEGVAPELSFPTPILRSVVIGDRLWTMSDAGLASSDLTTLGSTTFVPFA
jgi:hypothetical protein